MVATADPLAGAMAAQLADQRDIEARELLAQVATKLFARPAPVLSLGRYVDLARIGSGGMGIVYAATDPTLDRRVALKVLRPNADPDAELVAEARALAKLSHPHVVPVLDVGRQGDEQFIAMELVIGQPIDAWLTAAPRSSAEIIAAFADAGRGLAAAHQAGIVHLDVKPSNILVGDDGRVRVTDFGLARTLRSDPTAPDHARTEAAATGRGGTLGYAAPEQLDAGRRVTERADQFALGVSIYEALCGRLPFEAGKRDTLGPRPTEIPATIWRVIARAMAADPADRHPSMAVMVAALDAAGDAPSRRRPRLVLAAAGGGVALALLWAAGAPTDRRCSPDAEPVQAWDPATRAQAAAAFETTALPYARASFHAVDARLDSMTAAWSDTYRAVCETGPSSDNVVFDTSMRCLDRQRAGLEALVTLLAHADATVVERAVESGQALPDATRCLDPEPEDRTSVPIGPDRDAQAELQRRSAAAQAMIHAGDYTKAQAALGQAPAIVDAAALAPEWAEYEAMRGRVAQLRGDLDAAQQWLAAAHHRASAGGDYRRAALTAAALAALYGADLVQPDQASRWQRHAEAALQRWGGEGPAVVDVGVDLALVARSAHDLDTAERLLVGAQQRLNAAPEPDALRLAHVQSVLGSVYFDAARYPEARTVVESSLRLLQDVLGDDHPRLIPGLVDLGAIEHALGHPDASVPHYQRALQLARASLGDNHTQTAAIENNLGNVFVERHDDAQALVHFERAVAAFEAALGPDHPQTVAPRGNIGSIHARAGRHPQARKTFTEALTIIEDRQGDDDPVAAQLLVNLGYSEEIEGDVQAAAQRYTRALQILEPRVGPKHPDVAVVLSNLAALAQAQGDAEQAIALSQRVLQIRIDAFGDDHPAVAYARVAYGKALALAGANVEATAELQRAIVALARANAAPGGIAEAELSLAQVQRATGDAD